MNRCVTLLCCLLLVLPFSSFAAAESFPPDSGTTPPSATTAPIIYPENQLALTIGEQTLLLNFDSDQKYTFRQNGYVQASFYGTDENGLLYELYLIFPENVSSGSLIRPQTDSSSEAQRASIYLYISSGNERLECIAAPDETGTMPADADYAIHFEDVTHASGSSSFAGNFTSNLIVYDENQSPVSVIRDVSGSFRFTMDMTTAPEATPEAPEIPTPQPFVFGPGITPPPYAKHL